jgi:hypothetical protein
VLKGVGLGCRLHAIGVRHTGEGGPARSMVFYRYPLSRPGPDHECHRLSAAHDWKAEMEAKKAFLQELIKNDDLDEAALEMTKQVIAEGEDGLTPAQKFAFERNVLRKFVTQECQSGCDISWSEPQPSPHFLPWHFNGLENTRQQGCRKLFLCHPLNSTVLRERR